MYKIILELTDTELKMLIETNFGNRTNETQLSLTYKIAQAVLKTDWAANHEDSINWVT